MPKESRSEVEPNGQNDQNAQGTAEWIDPATHPLAGCHAKIARAYHHTEALKLALKSWGDSQPYAFVGYFDSEAGENIIRILEVNRPPLLEWGVCIGDLLHNLRSALDHLICVMAKQQNPAHPCVGTEFPIFDDEFFWEQRQRSGKLAPKCGVAKLGPADDWTIRIIRQQQPFIGGKEAPEEKALSILQKLNIIDKHRTLHLGVTYLYEPEVGFDRPSLANLVWVKPAGPCKHGDTIARYLLAEGVPQGQVKFEVQFAGEVVFDEGSTPAVGTKIDVMMDWLFDTVVYVVDLFDAHYFGGRPPAGSRTFRSDARGYTDWPTEGAHSNDPEAKRERWGKT